MASTSSASDIDDPPQWQPPDSDTPVQSWQPPANDAPVKAWTPPDSDAPIPDLPDGLTAADLNRGPLSLAIHHPIKVLGGALKQAGDLTRSAISDAMTTISGHPSYGGNLAQEQQNITTGTDTALPADQIINSIAATNPKTAVLANVAQGTAAALPLALGGGLPAAVQRGLALGFSAKMISDVKGTAQQLGDEMGKPTNQQDPAKIAQLKADLIQTGIFAPIAAAGGAGKFVSDISKPVEAPNETQTQKTQIPTETKTSDQIQTDATAAAPELLGIPTAAIKPASVPDVPAPAGTDVNEGVSDGSVTPEQPVLQPAIKIGDKIYSGGGVKHANILLAHAFEQPDGGAELISTPEKDLEAGRGFIDQDGKFYTRAEAAATGIFGDQPAHSENLPGFDENAPPPPMKVTQVAPDFHGGAQEDLPADQQAISKANNSREAFARVQAEADTKKQSPGTGLPMQPQPSKSFSQIMYRGDTRKPALTPELSEGGIHFTDDPEYAAEFSKEGFSNTQSGSLVKKLVTLKNPLDLTKFKSGVPFTVGELKSSLANQGVPMDLKLSRNTPGRLAEGVTTIGKLIDSYGDSNHLIKDFNPNEDLTDYIGGAIKKLGKHDGILFKEHGNDQISGVVFDSKSLSEIENQSPANGLRVAENTKNAPVAEALTLAQSLAPAPLIKAQEPTAPLQSAKQALQSSGSESPPPEVTPVPAQPNAKIVPESGGNPTAMKYRLIDQERQQRGLPPITKGESVSDEATFAKATDAIDKKPELPDQLVKELNNKPRSISDVENHVLLLRKIDLRNQYQKAADDLTKANEAGDKDAVASANVRVADVSDKLNDLETASRLSGSERGRSLRSLQVMANEDYSLAGLETRLRASKGGAPLTDAERAQLVKTAADYKKANDELSQHLTDRDKQIADLHVKAALDQILLDAKKSAAPKVPKRIGLLDTLKTRADAARARINARPTQLSAGIDPTLLLKSLRDEIEIGAYHIARIGTDVANWTAKNLEAWKESMKKEFGERIVPHLATILDAAKKTVDDLNRPPTHEEKIASISGKIKEKFAAGKNDEITGQVQKLAREFIQRGITGRDALIDAIHNVLKESDPEITRRETMDAISGYGDFKQLSKDEISKKLRDLKGQMQQVGKLEDIQSKKPPLKSGVERRTPSDEERKLIQQVNEAKRQHGVVVTDPETQLKSALEARKTYYKNQITDFEKQIEAREKFVKSKTPSPTDAELESLKARRLELKNKFDEIFNPKKTDAEKYQDSLLAEKKQLEKSIAEKQRQLKENDLSVKPKEMNRPYDPTLEPLKQQRDALNKEISKARAEAAKKPEAQKYAEALQRRLDAMNKSISEKEARIKSGNVEPNAAVRQNRPLSPELEQAKQKLDALNKQIQELRNPKKSDVEQLRDRIQRSITQLENKIATGDFSRKPKSAPIIDRRAQELTAQKEQVAKKFKALQNANEKAQLPSASKSLDFISNLRRFSVLSGVNVLGKLTAYSATKLPTIGATEAIGGALSKIPKLSQIAARAPSEGGLSLRALANATAKGLTKGFVDAYQTFSKGQSDLRSAFSTKPDNAREWYNIPQLFHEVIKSPLRRTAFELSLTKRMEYAASKGADISDPIVQLGLAKDAYLDSDRALLLENNRLANGIRLLMKNLEAKNKNTGQVPLGGKIGATIGRVELPILSVPLNYVKQTLTSAFGLVSGSIKARNAFKNGIENLDPKEADEILRHLKYGTIGGALLLYGFYDGYKNGGNGTLGGFYQPGEKRKDTQAGINGIRVGGHNIPGLALHNPLIAVAQLGHTMGAILASKLNKKTDQTHSVPVATVAALMGLLNQSPLGTTTELVSQLTDPRSAEYAMGEHVKGLLVPQLVQEAANYSDKDAKGNTTKRNPITMTQHIETGIPGLRQTVPKKK